MRALEREAIKRAEAERVKCFWGHQFDSRGCNSCGWSTRCEAEREAERAEAERVRCFRKHQLFTAPCIGCEFEHPCNLERGLWKAERERCKREHCKAKRGYADFERCPPYEF